jgi:hypothetical protein
MNRDKNHEETKKKKKKKKKGHFFAPLGLYIAYDGKAIDKDPRRVSKTRTMRYE